MSVLPKELEGALKRCDLLVGDEILDYYYNLFDPETGGFYYSISSRDLENMTPFAEGTRFVLESLAFGGIDLPSGKGSALANGYTSIRTSMTATFTRTSGARLPRVRARTETSLTASIFSVNTAKWRRNTKLPRREWRRA